MYNILIHTALNIQQSGTPLPAFLYLYFIVTQNFHDAKNKIR